MQGKPRKPQLTALTGKNNEHFVKGFLEAAGEGRFKILGYMKRRKQNGTIVFRLEARDPKRGKLHYSSVAVLPEYESMAERMILQLKKGRL